jgi:hypothetical protein
VMKSSIRSGEILRTPLINLTSKKQMFGLFLVSNLISARSSFFVGWIRCLLNFTGGECDLED